MAIIQNKIHAEIDPLKPVQEVCAVIMAVTPYHPGQEAAILQGIKDAINDRLNQLAPEGAETNE